MKFRRLKPTPLQEILRPGRSGLRKMSPEELAEYKAGWRPETQQWLLADAEQRRREGWSGPVVLSLLLSAIALAVSIFALLRRS